MESEETIIHWVWFDNENESYCGLDMTGHAWIPEQDGPVNCPKCIHIEQICEEFYEEDDND